MTPQETIRFESYVRSCGYSTKKEGGRYCQGVVNLLKSAWFAAQRRQSDDTGMGSQELSRPSRRARQVHRPLHI